MARLLIFLVGFGLGILIVGAIAQTSGPAMGLMSGFMISGGRDTTGMSRPLYVNENGEVRCEKQ